MVSLADQLRGIASADADRITAHHGAPSGKSYIFPAKEASALDFNAIYNIAISGLDEILELDPLMSEFEEELFGESTKSLDRMMLSQEANKRLDAVLDRCIRRLGQWLGLKSGAKCFEWLVRRFRVHEMNVGAVIQAFLPYHESSQFPRILAILKLDQKSPYYNLLHPLQKTPQVLDRALLVRYMSPAKDPSLFVLQDVMNMLAQAEQERAVHRALVNFWGTAILDFVERMRMEKNGIPEPVVKILVEGYIRALSCQHGGPDFAPAIYPSLLLCVRSVPLAAGPFTVILRALSVNRDVDIAHRLITLMIVLEQAPVEFVENKDRDLGEQLDQVLAGNFKVGAAKVGILINGVRKKFGLVKSVDLLVAWMLRKPVAFFNAIHTIISDPELPIPLVNAIAISCVSAPSTEVGEAAEVRERLIRALQERHPAIVTPILKNRAMYIVQAGPASEGVVGMDVDALIDDATPAFVQAVSADSASRERGVTRILSDTTFSEEDLASAKELLQRRLADNDASVVKAIYANPEQLSRFLSDAEIFAIVRAVVWHADLHRDVATAHVSYLANHAKISADTITADDIFCGVLFPFLLYTKSRRVTVAAVWNILLESALVKDGSGVFRGLKQAHGEFLADGSDVAAAFAEKNINVTKALARNIADSERLEIYERFLVSQIETEDPSSRLLAQFIVAELFSMLKSVHQVHLATGIISKIDRSVYMQSLATMREAGGLDASVTSEKAYSKPSHQKTAVLVQDTMITSLCKVTLPPSIHTLTLQDDATNSSESLAKIIYRICNSDRLPEDHAKASLQKLFTQLGQKCLIFLLSAALDKAEPLELRIVSIRHVQAFITAHASEEGKLQSDFQCVVPALLVLLSEQEKKIREATTFTLRLLRAGYGGPIKNVYGIDDIYGRASEKIQILQPKDLTQYLDDIVASAADINTDGAIVQTLHTRLLTADNHENKKASSHRRAVTSYLLSHIAGWHALTPRMTLFNILANVQDSIKTEALLPLLQELAFTASIEHRWAMKLSIMDQRRFISHLLDSLTARVAKSIARGQATETFDLLLTIIRKTDDTESNQKIQLLLSLLNGMAHYSENDAIFVKALIKTLSLDTQGVVDVIEHLSTGLKGDEQDRTKRSRTDNLVGTEQCAIALMHFLESQDLESIAAEPTLVSTGLQSLSDILDKQASLNTSVADYLQQALLSMMISAVSRIDDAAGMASEAIGVEVIVKMIRGSTNPRTSQQALLFIGSLARLVPDAVLHNVMPIFTYMGSSDFQRDDVHSFAVVEKALNEVMEECLSITLPAESSQRPSFFGAEWVLYVYWNASRKAYIGCIPSSRSRTSSLAVPLLQHVKTILQHLIVTSEEESIMQALVSKAIEISALSASDLTIDRSVEAASLAVLEEALKKLPVQGFLNTAVDALKSETRTIIARGLQLVIERVPLIQANMRVAVSQTVMTLTEQLYSFMTGNVQQLYLPSLQALERIAAVRIEAEDSILSKAIRPMLSLVQAQADTEVSSLSLRLVANLSKRLGTRMIPHVQSILELCRTLLASESGQVALVTEVLSSITIAVPGFISSEQLMQTIASVIRTPGSDVDKYLNTYIATLTKRVPTGTLLPSLLNIWQGTRSADEKVLVRFFYVFQRTIRQADRARLPALVRTTFKFFLEALDLCHDPQFPTISEDHMLPAFLDLVEKLNEATFKPLFSRLYDWAVISPEESNMVFDLSLEILNRPDAPAQDTELWLSVLKMFSKSFEVDEDLFWNEERYKVLVKHAVKQIGFVSAVGNATTEEALISLFASLARSTTSETVLKTVNDAVCMTTRSDDAPERLLALRVLDEMWGQQEELIQFAATTISDFISETLEDADPAVEHAAKKFLDRMRAVLGNEIDNYF
ncbi:hypothetical protein QFC22_003365 [Naganishia vaughanmartiniae]|uniref:Uncharacterized protein n=1 Tax=Naganishia vaughanmartiniae TaxID=1424756 RepID=A0ACC2X8C7_9TREE|nr:hypothetical protein QFC22_003365 [Naganishia vaughanmartiniae]